jgi:tetratricopeptide (TPR) repeat protein
VAELRKGAELARGTALEHKLLATVEQQAGNWRNVIARLRQARELPPADLWVYYSLAEAHLALGEDAQALAAVEQGLELPLRPSDEPAGPPQLRARWRGIQLRQPISYALASLYSIRADIYLRQKKYAAALADLNLHFYFTNHWHLYKRRAEAHFHLGQYEKARADFEKAVELAKGEETDAGALNTAAWQMVIFSVAELRDPKRAVALATKAVELAPKNGYIWNTLGVAHYRAGDCRAAVVALEKSLELGKGSNSFNWFSLAMAHWRLGDREKARTWYDKAVAGMEWKYPWEEEELKGFRAEAEALLGIQDPLAPPGPVGSSRK